MTTKDKIFRSIDSVLDDKGQEWGVQTGFYLRIDSTYGDSIKVTLLLSNFTREAIMDMPTLVQRIDTLRQELRSRAYSFDGKPRRVGETILCFAGWDVSSSTVVFTNYGYGIPDQTIDYLNCNRQWLANLSSVSEKHGAKLLYEQHLNQMVPQYVRVLPTDLLIHRSDSLRKRGYDMYKEANYFSREHMDLVKRFDVYFAADNGQIVLSNSYPAID
ncbi:MAG TPA: hypothetical protein VEA58_11535 [Anaerovoracaceae bacterium]|nr:hypothetical protein [Anaerovoracaceae bacterium]